MGNILCSSAISFLLVVCSAQRMWFSVAEDRDVNTHCYYTDGEHMHVAWGVWLIKLQLMQKSRTRNANPLPTFQSKPCALICLVPDIYSTDHPPHNALQSKSLNLGCRITCSQSPSGGYTSSNHCVSQLAHTSPYG